MTEQTPHTMQLIHTYASGAEEWQCSDCERRFVVQWPPRYKRIVLQKGNQDVVHTGGKGGLTLSNVSVDATPHMPLSDAWMQAVNDLDLDDWHVDDNE